MARKPPKTEHVKHVLARGKWYSYFNTGTKKDGKAVYAPLPAWGSVGFWDSYAACMAGRTKRQTKTYTVADLVADYLASTDYARKAPATRKVYKTYSRNVVAAWGKIPVPDLQIDHVRRVLDKEPWGAGAKNMVLAVLGVVYGWRYRDAAIKLDPTRGIARFDMGEHLPWPEDVLEAALKAEDDTVRLAVHLLYFTGQRISDVCRLRWGDVAGGYVKLMPGKTSRYRKTVEFPVAAELAVELERTPKTGLIILGGIKPDPLRERLQAFTRTLGVETVPHGLRKNAVIALLECGCTPAEVAAITAQTLEMVEHYAAQVNRRKLGSAAVLKWDLARRK